MLLTAGVVPDAPLAVIVYVTLPVRLGVTYSVVVIVLLSPRVELILYEVALLADQLIFTLPLYQVVFGVAIGFVVNTGAIGVGGGGGGVIIVSLPDLLQPTNSAEKAKVNSIIFKFFVKYFTAFSMIVK